LGGIIGAIDEKLEDIVLGFGLLLTTLSHPVVVFTGIPRGMNIANA
jgi:hypothetical protein